MLLLPLPYSRCLLSSGIPHKLEMSSLGDLKRDADLLLPLWDGGVSLAIDVAVCHPAPLSLYPLTPEASTRIVRDRATRKDHKYASRCIAAGSRFEPFVLTTWGSWGPGAESVWKDLVRRLAGHRRGKARSQLMEELQQGLSNALPVGVRKQLHSLSLARAVAEDWESPLA